MAAVFMFPGQSSVYPEMVERAIATWPAGTQILQDASDVLGWDVQRHFRSGNEQMFANNTYVQIGGFLTNHIYLCALCSAGIDTNVSLGLSLGEYNHLVHIEALAFEDALRLIAARGCAYDTGPNGKMVAVFPMEPERLKDIVSGCAGHGVIEIAGYNAPLQHMVGGEHEAVDRLIEAVEEETGILPVVTEARLPIHTSCFAPVSAAFTAALKAAPWQVPHRPYRPNVSAQSETGVEPAQFVELLAAHICRPVLWRASIESVWAEDPDAVFVEVGPRSVLYNMLSRSWHPFRRARTDHPESFSDLVDRLGPAS
jgi:[acyl-carrier-protein] S-malonyltransferase